MRSESEIQDRLELIEKQLENASGPDQSHLIGQRNILRWVIDEGGSESGSSHWAGQRGGQRR
jgi:hypothetical protein